MTSGAQSEPGSDFGHPARWRVLVGKVGLDGHDRGIRVVGRTLRDAGFEVIYTGLQQTPEMIVAAARDEDVDAIGLSMLSGAHLTLVPRVLDRLRAGGLDIPVVVGGIIPTGDIAVLTGMGVAAVLTPGASADEIVTAVTAAIVANDWESRPGHPAERLRQPND